MKSLFPLLPVIAGLLVQLQSIAIGSEVKSNQVPVQSTPGANAARTQDPPLSAEAEALHAVEIAVRNNPASAPHITAQAIRTDVPHPVPQACEIVRAAIKGLGNQATSVLVARIVYAAVTAKPNETLLIEAVAIEETPASFHRDIVSATLAAIPDPYDCIEPAKIIEPCRNVERPSDFGEQRVTSEPLIISEPCSGTTLAEAIYQEALLSGATVADFLFNPNLGYTGDYGTTGLANDNPINKQPLPTPSPVSP